MFLIREGKQEEKLMTHHLHGVKIEVGFNHGAAMLLMNNTDSQT